MGVSRQRHSRLTSANLLDIGDTRTRAHLFSTSLLLCCAGLRLAFAVFSIAMCRRQRPCGLLDGVLDLIVPLAWLFGTPAGADAVLTPQQP